MLSQDSFYLKDGDTVVFYGDSITEQRLYTNFTEAYVVTRFPQLNVRFVQSGWGGDRVTGGGGGPIDVRLQRDVLAYRPSVVTIMLGMNDGRYRSFDDEIYKEYTSGIEKIVKTLKTGLPNVRITAIEPSPYDDVTRPPSFEGGYNGVMVRYGSFIRKLGQKENLTVADLNSDVTEALRKANAKDPVIAQKIISDRIHPGAAGHLLMAEALLKSWKAPSIVIDVAIDAEALQATQMVRADVSSIAHAGDTLSWTETDGALPMPVDFGDATTNLAVQSSDFATAVDDERLRVTNLKSGDYTLRIDGETVGTYSAERWDHGVNLAVLQTPMLRQANDVWLLTVYHNNLHNARWRLVQVALEKYALRHTGAAMSEMDTLETEIVAAQHEAAQPKVHRYELVRHNGE